MSEFDLSKVMNGWTQEGILGSGAFGTVYLARNTETGAFSAVKVIKTPPGREAVDNALKLGIGQELLSTYFGKFKNDLSWELTMYKTVKSQHLETVEDIITVDADGPGWTGYIRKGIYTPMAVYFDKAPATQEDAARLGVEIASALDALAQYTMVHGEVKPENIFVSDTGEFVLGDYGVRRCLEKAGSGIFSAEEDGFEAPEVGQDRLYTARSDIYSLGALMAYTANGCQMPPNRDPGAIRDLDPAFAAIIKKTMAADPKERYQTAMQLKLELQRLTLGKKPPRRAMAAAAAFDAVKRNGGAAITSGAVITGRGVTREKPAKVPAGETPSGKASASGKHASGRTDTVEETARAAAENTEVMKRKNAKAGAVVALAAALLVLAVVLLVMVPWRTGGPVETIPVKTSGHDTSGPAGSPSDSAASQPVPSETDASEPPSTQTEPPATETEPPTTETTPPTTEPPATETTPPATNPPETNPPETNPPETTPPETKPQPTKNDILFPSDTELITREFLETKTRDEISFIFNEMYARHGYIFKEGGAFAEYFETQKWYKPVTTSQTKVTDQFSDIEWQNFVTITNYQKEMGWRDSSFTVPTRPTEPPTTEPPTTEPPATEPPATEPPATEPPVTEPPATEPPATKPEEVEYVYPSDKQVITREELEAMDKDTVNVVLNEIYARHGYIFSNQGLKEYFEAQPWYAGVTNNAESVTFMFNETEKQNVSILYAYQREKGWRN